MFDRVRHIADEPVSDGWVERMVSFALIIWTFGQIVLVHSGVSQLPFVVESGLGQFHQAITVGCLVAAVACRGFGLKPMGTAALFCALFVTITVWREANDASLIIVLLFILAAKDMDVPGLVRQYVYGALVGLLVVCVFVARGVVPMTMLIGAESCDVLYGFKNAATLPCLVFSIVVGVLVSWSEARLWRYAIACCIVGAVVELLLGCVLAAVLLLVLAAGACVRERRPRAWMYIMRAHAFRWLVALLPLALFCIANDGGKYFGLAVPEGVLPAVVGLYGYGACACFAVLYVRSVLLMKVSGTHFIAMMACVLFSFMLLYMRPVINLEFNCAYLILALGLDGSTKLMSPIAYDVDAVAEKRDGEASS